MAGVNISVDLYRISVGALYRMITGNRAFKLQGMDEKPLCANDFFHKYHNKPEWEKRVDNFSLSAIEDPISGKMEKVLITISVYENEVRDSSRGGIKFVGLDW
jgi:hypothetical protein